MHTPHQRLAAVGLLMLLLSIGCASNERIDDAHLPLGVWEGRGTFVAAPGNHAATNAPDGLFTRAYDTSATIETTTHAGQPALKLTILSASQGLDATPDPNMVTHIVLILRERGPIDANTRVYGVVATGISDTRTAPELDTPDEPILITATAFDDDLVLHVPYGPTFNDTFVFDGDELEKFGVFYPDDSSGMGEFVHWCEVLERVDD